MAWQVVERGVFPEDNFGAVGEMVMPVGGGGHGLEDRLFAFTAGLIFDEEGCSVSECLEIKPASSCFPSVVIESTRTDMA